jgi:polyisoprenoid-binding protein YceI
MEQRPPRSFRFLPRPPAAVPVLAGALALAAAPACAVEYSAVLAERSRIAFTSKQMGVPVEGQFGRFATALAFDPAHPEAGRATIEIDLASIDAGSAEANEEVVGKNWFNAKAYPTARFTASSVKPLSDGRFEVRGPLTLKGRTQEVAAPVSFRREGNLALFEGTFTLKRLDFAIGEGAWGDVSTVANEVQIKFRIAAAAAGQK